MLSDAKVLALKPREKPYKVSDAEGLFLLINPNGSRLWRLATPESKSHTVDGSWAQVASACCGRAGIS